MYKGLKYNQATPVFHQWRDHSRQVYGIKFNNQEEADGFAEVVRTVLDSLQSMHINCVCVCVCVCHSFYICIRFEYVWFPFSL